MKIKFLLIALLFSIQAFSQNFSLVANVNINSNQIRFLELKIGTITVFLDDGGEITGFQDGIFEGSIDYNDFESEEKENFGKIKNINDLTVEYWKVNDRNDPKFGKISKIGNLQIDYWDAKTGNEKLGKVKSIGSVTIDYWKKAGFDITIQGKYSRIGDVGIDYYNDQNEKSTYGYLKDIGDVHFSYWDEYFSSDVKVGRLRTVSGNSENVLVKVF